MATSVVVVMGGVLAVIGLLVLWRCRRLVCGQKVAVEPAANPYEVGKAVVISDDSDSAWRKPLPTRLPSSPESDPLSHPPPRVQAPLPMHRLLRTQSISKADLFRAADADGDGMISRTEFDNFLSRVTSQPGARPKAQLSPLLWAPRPPPLGPQVRKIHPADAFGASAQAMQAAQARRSSAARSRRNKVDPCWRHAIEHPSVQCSVSSSSLVAPYDVRASMYP